VNNLEMNDLFPKLNRPEYPTSPEIFISSIAERMFTVAGVPSDARRKFRRLRRQADSVAVSGKGSSKVEFSWERLTSLSSDFPLKLQESGFSVPGQSRLSSLGLSDDFVSAILSGVIGTTSVKSDSFAVSPMTPSLALLQTVRGMKGTSSNFAGMFEQIWKLGGGDANESVAERWLSASSRLMEQSPQLKALDSALDSTHGFGPRTLKEKREEAGPFWAIGLENPNFISQTPMGWFNRAWTNLTNEDWIDALPPRIWTDWANSVLRTAFGMTYLWEATWYHALADAIVSGKNANSAIEQMGAVELIPWQPEDLPISLRGVKGSMDKKIRTGSEIRDVLRKYITEAGIENSSAADGFLQLRKNPNFIKKLVAAKNLPTQRHSSTVEAVSYSLNIRKEFGEGADHFGLLSLKSARFRVPDPGTEWLAAVVSLSSARPQGSINLGSLLFELNSMGLNPPNGELVGDLEKAGLARGSADSDIGLKIDTAF